MRLDKVDSVSNFSGFGPVYVADRKRVRAYRENNFDLDSLHDHGGFWVANEVIVVTGERRIEKASQKNPKVRNNEN